MGAYPSPGKSVNLETGYVFQSCRRPVTPVADVSPFLRRALRHAGRRRIRLLTTEAQRPVHPPAPRWARLAKRSSSTIEYRSAKSGGRETQRSHVGRLDFHRENGGVPLGLSG